MRPDRPVVLGVIGDSGSGKSTLISGVGWLLAGARVTDLCLDDYHRYDRAERSRRALTALHPDCNRLDVMGDHLRRIRRGESVTKPVYDHRTGTFGPDEVLSPGDYVLVHGLLGLHDSSLERCYDLTVFLDPDPDLRIRWKLQRDISRRGYSEARVRAQLEHRMADVERYVRPQRERADIVVRFVPAEGMPPTAHITLGARSPVAVKGLLRTVCERVASPTIRLCDDETMLEIDGEISDCATHAAVHALAERLPGDPEARATHLGTVIEGTAERHSNTLAVAQMVVTSMLLAAAARAATPA
ncbi:MAG TPA: phosphoribulokinase [Gemmatimonadaceae bacterium]|nr:phosphoribulokinase [Gemmatimonadaceae bacterium]